MAKKVTGRKRVWQLLETVGKGDAGEVVRVEAELGREQGVMKRPVQNVSGGTIVRQARQIENEGKALALLDGLDLERHGRKIHTPLLMDQSIEGTSSSANLFIVSEEVSGVSISELLRRKLQGDSPISQALVLKVLAAAFQMLQNAHEKGVIWNDVKMDHIFWDAETNVLSFIDWGNSLNLNDQTSDDKASPMLDYQQLLEEGRALIEQTSPELIADIGWLLSASKLDDLAIHHLQMRVEYMETYLSMRIIEYKLLFGRYLKSLDSLAGLKQTLELMHALQQLGVEVDANDLLSVSQSYLLELLDQGEKKQAQEVFQVLEAELNRDLSPNWQLAGYLLQHLGDGDPAKLAQLLHAIFESNWTDAAWIYNESFLKGKTPPASDSIINSMRNLKLNSKPYALIIADLTALRQQSEHWLETAIQKRLTTESISTLQNLTDRVSQLQQAWEYLQPGEKLGDKFLLLRQVLEHFISLQLRPATDLQTSILAAMSRIREIYRAWAECDLITARKQTRELFLLEPSLGYLPEMEADFSKMIDWLETLNQGPADHQAVNKFSAELLESLPPLAERLGEVPWLSSLLHALKSMKAAQAIENLREEARLGQWPMPWLDLQSLHLEISESYRDSVRLDASQKACLAEYHQALKASMQPAGALKKIRQQLPAFHQAYTDLAGAFATLFSQLRGDAPLPAVELFPQEDRGQVAQVIEMLITVRKWKEHIRSSSPAKFRFPEALLRQWDILVETRTQNDNWRNQLLPKLTEIKQKRWQEFPVDLALGNDDPFALARAALAKLQLSWKRIPEQGLYRELIEEMIYQIDTAQSHFFKFWQSLQRSNSVVTQWLSGNFQANFSEINQSLLQISRKLRSVELAFNVVNQPAMARTRMAQNSAGDLMFTLVQLDEHIMPQSRKPSIFRSWQQQFLELLKQGDRRHIVESIQTIEAIHPLLPWFDELVSRDADYFNLPKSQQW
jgi:serine/threonine protein kinase